MSLFGNLILRTSLESTAAGKVAEQNLAFGLVLVADETKTKKEAAESVLLIVHRLFGAGDAFLIPCHFAQLADKGFVGCHFIRSRNSGEPGKCDCLIRYFNGKAVNTQGFLNERPFGSEECVEVGMPEGNPPLVPHPP